MCFLLRYILNTDGRGWKRPAAVLSKPGDHNGTGRDELVTKIAAEQTAGRCGGVDAGPYGLAAHQDTDDAFVPFLDSLTRPHSVVVPWQPGRAVLYGMWHVGCHRALFDHCNRATSTSASAGRRVRALHKWMTTAVEPHVTPSACATNRWYPGMWGVLPAARRLKAVTATHGTIADGEPYPGARAPNHLLYAIVVVFSLIMVSAILYLKIIVSCGYAVYQKY